MTLKSRLIVYLVLNGLVLGAVALSSYHLGQELDSQIQNSLKLELEARLVRRLHHECQEELRLGDEMLLAPEQSDLSRYRTVIEAISKDIGELTAQPTSQSTLLELPKWRLENTRYEELFRHLFADRKRTSIGEVQRALRSLRDQSQQQVGVLAGIVEDVNHRLAASDEAMREVIRAYWVKVVGLCVLPMAAISLLLLTFTRSLSVCIMALQKGFESLAAGQFGIRIGPSGGGQRPKDELSPVLERFDQTAERLGRLHQLRSQVYSVAAHDLRSPLNRVLLALQAFSDPKVSQESQTELLLTIEQKTRHALDIIEHLLESFFGEGDSLQLQSSRVNVNDVMETIAAELTSQAAERKQSLVVRRIGGDGALWCDPAKLAQVLENLVLNAITYSHEGDVIKIGASEPEGGLVLFQVTDSGPGIPEEQRKQLFDPLLADARGTGGRARRRLGLMVCREAIVAHGGSIWVESTPGKGSRFCFTIPRDTDART